VEVELKRKFACGREFVEVDGGPHAIDEAKDLARMKWLGARGYRVLRFWNNDVLANTGGVIITIHEALEYRLPDTSFPLRGGA